MKTKIVYKTLLLTLIVSLFCSALLFCMTSYNASANTENIKMDTVASVRLKDEDVENDVSGIRFFVHMNETAKNQAVKNGYGFLIFPQRYLENVTTGKYHTELTRYVEIDGDVNKIYANGTGNWTANGVLAPVNELNYDEQFTCVAYLINDDTAEEDYTYAQIDAEFSRSVLQVASLTFIDSADDRTAITDTYGLGSETNPIQIFKSSDLELLSKAVADGDTFEGVYFKLMNDIVLSNSFTPVASTFAGSVNANGVTITGNFSATVFENESVLTGTALTKVVMGERPTELFTINENKDGITLNVSEAEVSYVANADLPDALKSDFTGNAYKWSNMFASDALISINNEYADYSMYRLEQMLAYNYDYATFKMAIVDNNNESTDWSYTTYKGLISETEQATESVTEEDIEQSSTPVYNAFTFSNENAGAWQQFTVTMEDYISFIYGKESLVLFDNKVSNITANSGESNLDLYITAVEFGFKPISKEYFTVTEETYTALSYSDYVPSYVPYETWLTTFGLTEDTYDGEYKSAAMKLKARASSTTYNFTVPKLTVAQKTAILSKYATIKFNIAVHPTSGSPTYIKFNNSNAALANKLFSEVLIGTASNATYGYDTWIEVKFSVEDFFSFVGENEEIGLYRFNAATGTTHDVYVSDFVFEEPSADYITWSEANAGNIQRDSSYKGTFIAAADMATQMPELTNASEYTGNAVRVSAGYGSWKTGWALTYTKLSDEARQMIANNYKYLTFYLAVKPTYSLETYTTSQYLTFNSSSKTTANWFYNHVTGNKHVSFGTNHTYQYNTWVKFQIPVNDFFASLEACDPDGTGTIKPLFLTYAESNRTHNVYVSDFTFTNE